MGNRAYLAGLALTVTATLIAGCGAAVPRTVTPAASRAASHAPEHNGAACRLSQLQLTAGPRISEKTEQHTLVLVFRNVSATACDMRGYPAIALADSTGRRLSFVYRPGGDQMLTSAPPGLVRLPPGGYAYSALNKNVCVSFTRTSAARAEVTPPGQHEPLDIALAHYPILDYCGRGDPGHTIDIAPVESTSAGVLANQ
jgi:Protein of unknown function (DUF4232)